MSWLQELLDWWSREWFDTPTWEWREIHQNDVPGHGTLVLEQKHRLQVSNDGRSRWVPCRDHGEPVRQAYIIPKGDPSVRIRVT